jgi:hypothetical protein
LWAIRSGHELIQAREFQEQTHQPDAAWSYQGDDKMRSDHQPMEKNDAYRRFQKRHHGRVSDDILFALEPMLNRGARYAQFFGHLSLTGGTLIALLVFVHFLGNLSSGPVFLVGSCCI